VIEILGASVDSLARKLLDKGLEMGRSHGWDTAIRVHHLVDRLP
jgi:hypothetical protein